MYYSVFSFLLPSFRIITKKIAFSCDVQTESNILLKSLIRLMTSTKNSILNENFRKEKRNFQCFASS